MGASGWVQNTGFDHTSADEQVLPSGRARRRSDRHQRPRRDRLRFGIGIGCEREHTLEEIGQEFDVTRERICQIEARALRQLRSP
jgi:hypothetical protein